MISKIIHPDTCPGKFPIELFTILILLNGRIHDSNKEIEQYDDDDDLENHDEKLDNNALHAIVVDLEDFFFFFFFFFIIIKVWSGIKHFPNEGVENSRASLEVVLQVFEFSVT